MGDKVVTLVLSQDKLQELRRWFPDDNDAALVERAVEDCLRHHQQREPARSPLLSMIGMLEGETDMSARHDEFGVGADPA